MGSARINFSRALFEQGIDRLHQGAGGVDDVVEDEAGAALDVADDVHHLGDVNVGLAACRRWPTVLRASWRRISLFPRRRRRVRRR